MDTESISEEITKNNINFICSDSNNINSNDSNKSNNSINITLTEIKAILDPLINKRNENKYTFLALFQYLKNGETLSDLQKELLDSIIETEMKIAEEKNRISSQILSHIEECNTTYSYKNKLIKFNRLYQNGSSITNFNAKFSKYISECMHQMTGKTIILQYFQKLDDKFKEHQSLISIFKDTVVENGNDISIKDMMDKALDVEKEFLKEIITQENSIEKPTTPSSRQSDGNSESFRYFSNEGVINHFMKVYNKPRLEIIKLRFENKCFGCELHRRLCKCNNKK